MMGRMKPIVVNILMAFQAVAIHHQGVGGNEVTIDDAGAKQSDSQSNGPAIGTMASGRVMYQSENNEGENEQDAAIRMDEDHAKGEVTGVVPSRGKVQSGQRKQINAGRAQESDPGE